MRGAIKTRRDFVVARADGLWPLLERLTVSIHRRRWVIIVGGGCCPHTLTVGERKLR